MIPNYGVTTGQPLQGGGGLLPPMPTPPPITPAGGQTGLGIGDYAGTGTKENPITAGLGLRHVDANGDLAGLNWGTVGSIGQIGSSLMTAWNAWQQNKIAKETLNFQKDAYNTNMNNTIQSYNTALEDRIGARYAAQGKSQGAANQHIQREQLSR